MILYYISDASIDSLGDIRARQDDIVCKHKIDLSRRQSLT